MSESRPTEEEMLTLRFVQGDAEALCTLFDHYETLLRHRIGRILPPHLRRRVSAEDILQEARMTAFDRRADFELRGEGALRRWILGIVEKKSRRAVQWHEAVGKRSTSREVTRGQRLDTGLYAGDAATPSQVAVAAELADQARQAMQRLPESYREVLRLRREEHLTTAQTAERLERSPEAVKKLYGRALARFGQVLRELRGETVA